MLQDAHMAAPSGKATVMSPELRKEIRHVAPYDFLLLAAVIILLGLGAVMVYSATVHSSSQLHGNGFLRLRSHLINIGIGLMAMMTMLFVPYTSLRRLTYPSLGLTVLLLIAVIIIGVEAGNARRWLALPGFNLQPAEIAKLVFVLFLAHSIAKKAGNIRRFSVAFIPHFLVCSLLILLCLFQPDFGTSMILVLIMFTMLFVAGTRFSYITLFFFVGGFLAFQAIAHNDMRLGRVLATIDPWAHRTERGYQMVNSQIAIGSGGMTGQGIGFGGQTVTGYLPEGHTDFIFSVIAEQLGFIGVILVALCIGIIIFRGVRIALHTENAFGRMLAFGITLLLGVEAIINVLVAVAVIPTKGLTLPFVSYGGSSMLVSSAAVGILLNISRTETWGKVTSTFPELLPAIPEKKRGKSGKSQIRHQDGAPKWRFMARFKKKSPQSVDELMGRQLGKPAKKKRRKP